MPAIFSGEIFDGNESPSSYYDRCINELGFPNQLYDQGYRVNLLPRLRMDKSRYNNHFRVPDTFGGSRGFRRRQAAGQLLDIGLFRQLPHYAKKWMHNNGQWRISGVFSTPPNHRSIHQREFLRDYISRIDPVLENPSYNFIHMMSPHPPYGVKADGSPSHDPMPLTRESYKHEARYSLRVFMDLLRRLKALGIYDEALIILQGDHGSDFAPVVEGQVRELPTKRAPTLLAIKAPQATGPLEISHIPSSIADVPATVADILGIGSNYPGVSLLDLDRDWHRPREFFHYLGRDRGNPALKRFIVDGPVLEAGSWREMGVVDVVQDASDYNWGELVAFGMEGNADAFTRGGWGAPFSNGQWSDGKRAHLEFQVADPGEDVVFLFSMRPFLAPGKLDQQRVTILVNEMNLATLAVTEPQPRGYVLTIPKEWVDSGKILITLELPDAAIPSELGVGEDNRMLGLSFISIWLFPESMKDEVTRRAAESKPSGEKN